MDRIVERLATITDHLVSFPTVASNPTALQGCVDWVRAFILTRAPRLHLRQFLSNGKPALLLSAGDMPPRVLCCGHLDVVEATQPSAYQAIPLGENRLQGRGVADMKGPVAALLDILVNDSLPGMGVLLTTDEEIGGQDGTAHVLQQLDWLPEVVILPDGGANMRLVTAQKGVLRLNVTATGRAAHGSRPWLGDNAIERLYRGYQSLLRAYPIPASESDWRVSITLSELHGGQAPNSVPWQATATLDVRFPATGPHAGETLFHDIQCRLQRHNVQAQIAKLSPAFELDLQHPCVARLQEVAQSLLQHPLPLSREAGASDAHYFAALGVPVLMFQPECADWHGAGEWINLESLATFRTLCAGFVKTLLGREKSARNIRTIAIAASTVETPATDHALTK